MASDNITSLINFIDDGLLMTNLDGVIKLANGAFEKIWDTSTRAIAGKNLNDIFPQKECDSLKNLSQQAILKGSATNTIIRFAENSKWLRVEATPSTDGLIFRFRDITQDKINHDNWFIDQHSLQLLINITDHPIWLVNTACIVKHCNNAFTKWISYFTNNPLSVGDSMLSDELGETYLNKFTTCYQLALDGKEFKTVEDVMVDGELKFVTITFNPVFDENRIVTGICCYADDITDERKNLTRINSQTKALMEIAYIQSHKIRGPVATLLGLSNIFNYDDPYDPLNAEVLTGVRNVTTHLDDIVRDVIHLINRLTPDER